MTLPSRHRIRNSNPGDSSWGRARSLSVTEALQNTRGWGRSIMVSFKPPRLGNESGTLAWKAAVHIWRFVIVNGLQINCNYCLNMFCYFNGAEVIISGDIKTRLYCFKFQSKRDHVDLAYLVEKQNRPHQFLWSCVYFELDCGMMTNSWPKLKTCFRSATMCK